jgi:hypothetical protein
VTGVPKNSVYKFPADSKNVFICDFVYKNMFLAVNVQKEKCAGATKPPKVVSI